MTEASIRLPAASRENAHDEYAHDRTDGETSKHGKSYVIRLQYARSRVRLRHLTNCEIGTNHARVLSFPGALSWLWRFG